MAAEPVPYSFAGVRAIFDDSKARITIAKFARLSSELFAYGDATGRVRVMLLDEPPSLLHELPTSQGRPVTDMDWSLENTFLLTAAEDGSIYLWLTEEGTLVRQIRPEDYARCCRFHPINQNLIMVGNAKGTVQVYNTSTGLKVQDEGLQSSHPEGVGAAAMDCSSSFLFVADTNGYIHAFQCALKQGVLQPLTLLHRTPPAGSQLAQTVTLSYNHYCSFAQGPALLTSDADNLVAVYKVVDKAKQSKVELKLLVKALMPPTYRQIRAAWCPMLPSNEPEYIAMGGEDTSVYIYDVAGERPEPAVVNKLLAHRAPVVEVCWSYDEHLLASCDCDGIVIVWKRDRVASAPLMDTDPDAAAAVPVISADAPAIMTATGSPTSAAATPVLPPTVPQRLVGRDAPTNGFPDLNGTATQHKADAVDDEMVEISQEN